MTRGEEVDAGGGLSMDVRPMDARGRTATFQVTYLNGTNAPAAIALMAWDAEDKLRFRIEPEAPVVVPAGGTSAITVHAVLRGRRGAPHPYEIELRGVNLGTPNELNPALIRRARFTYVPRVPMPVPATLLAWVRRLPMWTLALPLVLLFLLLVLAASRTLASPTTRTAVMRTPAATRAVGAVQPTRPRVRPPRTGPRTGAPVATRTPPRAAAPAWSVVLLNPEQLDFGKQDVNTTGPMHTIHIANAGPAPLTVIAITTKGSAARDYAERNTCVGATIGAYKGCTISVRFTPRASGMRTANMVILDNGANGPQHVVLTGDGR